MSDTGRSRIKARENFNIAVNPYPREFDGSDRVTYSHMVYLTREEQPDMVKNDILRAVMRHAVAGHDNGTYHKFCNDADHANDIIMEGHFVLSPTFSKSDKEDVARGENEGMVHLDEEVQEFPSHGAHPIYRQTNAGE